MSDIRFKVMRRRKHIPTAPQESDFGYIFGWFWMFASLWRNTNRRALARHFGKCSLASATGFWQVLNFDGLLWLCWTFFGSNMFYVSNVQKESLGTFTYYERKRRRPLGFRCFLDIIIFMVLWIYCVKKKLWLLFYANKQGATYLTTNKTY